MELADTTPLVEIPPESYPKADAMRSLLNADLEEHEIATAVMAFRFDSMEIEQGAWSLLQWKEKDAWKQYRQLAHNLEKVRG